ncbi:protein SCO1/2 [Salsuginibacillus halophilus]|uniref:Protein SCO1/2 n=2 Tax=Salsuginibacillus halophilus TaxID=517424 RepID=A0A2P8HXS3_9BACI|nr:protein SCO1/2 [Salsuginibacillus halophilus]
MRMRRLQIMLVACVIATLSGCGWLYESEADSGSDLSGQELYVEEFEAENEQGETVTNEDLEGTYWMASMVFTRCPSVCNTMTPNMSSLQAELEEREADIQFVSFTVDPSFDTPERLHEYGEAYHADFETWDFLTGYSDEWISDFAEASFQSVVQEDPEANDIIHATSFFLVNEKGQVVHTFDGMDTDTEGYAGDVEAIVED